jgi:2-polyprenyl-3-methyl-5-hydroxy-6-metoxy-1,4-benzoquinol methylase
MQEALEQSASQYKDHVIAGWEKLYSLKIKRMVNLFKPYFQGNTVLEMGVADGEMTGHLVNHFADYTLIDGSKTHLDETMKKLAGMNMERVNAVHALFEEYKPSKKYDAIIMAHILEHLEDPVGMLRKAKEWLSKNGRIFIAVPNAGSLHRQVGVKLGILEYPHSLSKQDKILGHFRVYYPDEVRRHVRQAGYRIEKFGGLMVKPLSNRQIASQWSNELIDAFFALSEDFPELCSEIYIVASAR